MVLSEKQKEAAKKYRQSEKGKAAAKRWAQQHRRSKSSTSEVKENVSNKSE